MDRARSLRRSLFALPLAVLALGCLSTRGPSLPEKASAPDFTLASHEGKTVHLADELRSGPVVLVFYRGFW